MLRTVLSILILFAVIWFAVSNAAEIRLNVFFWNISVSAALVIFTTFVAGFTLGVLRVVPAWFRTHGLMNRNQKELTVCKGENKEYAQRIEELEMELVTERQKAIAAETSRDDTTKQ